ncbi:Bifunctional solanapyrone synthase [Fusarium oxysporum f. sp. rapae]|uniref:Bifunctional solanapyrone synthase n=1 Tax=Fusarium oxysporum f. sp. rapae TaxID=485398 RepID=A0A8J5TPD5_FUSOX|nr:Bifunctional solanapyrone synthase [Fusarium oxysporum f. sp. rapae]
MLPQSNPTMDNALQSPLSVATELVVSKLLQQFPEQVFEEHHPRYSALQNSYWSGYQKPLKPRCFFQPHCAEELSRAVALCARGRCLFGVKSGGHGHFAGQSSIKGGIQIDLVKLKTLLIKRSEGTVLVGTGNTWGSVYERLQKEGLIVVGGRAANVGVGGYLVGGGISFYAARHGWGIDNVRSFEIVLADGRVVTASSESEPNLYRALRGGGSNFGIITAFELEAYPYNGMWGGRTILDSIHDRQAIAAYTGFVKMQEADPKGPNGHTIFIATYDEGPLRLLQYMVYTEPESDLHIFDELRKVPAIESSLGLTDYTALAQNIAGLQDGVGHRASISTLTFKLDQDLLNFAYDVFVTEATPKSQYINATMEFHAIPRTSSPAGNMFGLERADGPLVVFLLIFVASDARHDDEVTQTQKTILGHIEKEAKRRHLYHPFLFANYSAEWQNVFGSYGDANRKFLTEVANEYDPDRVFQCLQPGSFKISNPGSGRQAKV